MKEGKERSKELGAKIIDAELKMKENKVYTALLMTIGLVLTMIITGLIMIQEFYIAKEQVAILCMGLVLFFAGWIWRTHDERKVLLVDEEFEELGNIQEEGERKYSNN